MSGGRFAAVIAALVEAQQAPLSTLSDAESRADVEDAYRALAMVQAAVLGAVRNLDARPQAVAGAKPTRVARTFLVHRLHVSGPQATRDVSAAHALEEDLPLMGAALAAGEVHREHVDVAAQTLRKVPRHLLHGRVDEYLVEQSRALCARDTRQLGRALLARLDPDGQDRFDPHSYERRHASMGVDATGMTWFSVQLGPVEGARFRAAVEAFAKPAPAGRGETEDGDVVPVPDTRTRPQRLADAVIAVVELALSKLAPGSVAAESARVTVVATPEQVRAASEGGAPAGTATEGRGEPVGPRQLGRWLCGGLVERVLLAPSGAVLDLGRTERLFSPGQKRAMTARDRGCVIPHCSAPGSWCDAHHVRSWGRDGPTDIGNGALLCKRHHTEVHLGVWELEVRDGIPWVRPPTWVDPKRRWLRNPLPDALDRARRLGDVA